MLKRTPLFEIHQQRGARMAEFGGWEMPIQYSGIIDEHHAVRRAAGLFDISHMGEVEVIGPSALPFLNGILTNDLRKLAPGHGQYTLLCNRQGGVIDDLYAYRLGAERYLLIINASRIEADLCWMQERFAEFPFQPGTALLDQSETLGALALQGPKAGEIAEAFLQGPSLDGAPVEKVRDLAKNQVACWKFQGHPLWVARTGYTGEDGFELVAPAPVVTGVWQGLFDAGSEFGLKPAGLGARDTLRTEMCYPLYGHELDEGTTPLEAGLGAFVSFDKSDFVGRARLWEQKTQGIAKKCVAFQLTERGAPPRPGYNICAGKGGESIGTVVSGTQSPSLEAGIGLGYVKTQAGQPGTAIEIEVRGKRLPAVIVKKPLYKKAV